MEFPLTSITTIFIHQWYLYELKFYFLLAEFVVDSDEYWNLYSSQP